MFLTWRSQIMATSPEVAQDSLRMAAFTGAIYWLMGLTAIYFPGADGLDPEFGGPGFPQRPVFIMFTTCALAGSWLASR